MNAWPADAIIAAAAGAAGAAAGLLAADDAARPISAGAIGAVCRPVGAGQPIQLILRIL